MHGLVLIGNAVNAERGKIVILIHHFSVHSGLRRDKGFLSHYNFQRPEIISISFLSAIHACKRIYGWNLCEVTSDVADQTF